MATKTVGTYYNLITANAIKDGTKLAVKLTEKNPLVPQMAIQVSNEKMGNTGTRVTSLAEGGFRKVSGYKTSGRPGRGGADPDRARRGLRAARVKVERSGVIAPPARRCVHPVVAAVVGGARCCCDTFD